nr:monocarboxylate transporter [Hymenolepis microstoma]
MSYTQNLNIKTDKSVFSNGVPALVDPQLDVNSTRYEYWGWVVLFSAFVCTGVVDGLLFSFGLNILAMMETPTFLSWISDDHYIPFYMYLLPGALLTGMHLYASPLANVLSNQFDYRPVAMTSALLSGVILVSSAFITNIEAFSIFLGICGGLSCGLLYFPSLSIVAQWFESRRALAVGLAICGSGVGTCLISAFFPGALETFSWRALLIIFGAVFFQLSVVIALFRPIEIQQIINLEKSKKRAKERQLRIERERIAAVVRREKLRQLAAGQTPNQRRSPHPRTGGIMNRIIEEKFRQLNTSTGSLDGMVITRDNELISFGTDADYELVRQTAVAAVCIEGQAGSHDHIGQLSSSSIQSHTRRLSASDRLADLPKKNTSQPPLSNPQPAVLLYPPHDFSKSGVIRIADAILQKLEAQAVIAPGMRCPDINSVFRRWPSGFQNALIPEGSTVLSPQETVRQVHHQHPAVPSENYTALALSVGRSRDPSNATKLTTITNSTMMGIGTGNSLFRPLSAMDNVLSPTLCISSSSEKAESMSASGVEVGRQDRSEDTYCLVSHSRPIYHSFSDDGSSNIDPKTDRAISSELSRVYLDSAVKARIRAAIYRELKQNTQINPVSQDRHKYHNKVDAAELPQKISYCSLDGEKPELLTGGGPTYCPSSSQDASARPSSNPAQRYGVPVYPSGNRRALMSIFMDKLDLQLLRSPSFLLFSLACTLHMFAFFAPYHMLPVYISLEGRTLSCGQLILSSYFGGAFRIPERLASPVSLTFTIGIGHLLGRLIATFYIERIVSEPSFLHHNEGDDSDDESTIFTRFPRRILHTLRRKLADPMILNIFSLMVGGVCLLCIPLTTLPIPSSQPIPSCSYFTPLKGILFALVFLHTLFSALAISLRSFIAVELIGVHHLTAAFVYLLVFQGTGAIAGPIAIGLLSESISRVRINAQLLSEPQYLFTGTHRNPLNWAYYVCGLVFLLSALTFAPLRLISAWETRRYFSKRKIIGPTSGRSTNSAFNNTPDDVLNQQLRRNDSSCTDGASVFHSGDGQLSLPSTKPKTLYLKDFNSRDLVNCILFTLKQTKQKGVQAILPALSSIFRQFSLRNQNRERKQF